MIVKRLNFIKIPRLTNTRQLSSNDIFRYGSLFRRHLMITKHILNQIQLDCPLACWLALRTTVSHYCGKRESINIVRRLERSIRNICLILYVWHTLDSACRPFFCGITMITLLCSCGTGLGDWNLSFGMLARMIGSLVFEVASWLWECFCPLELNLARIFAKKFSLASLWSSSCGAEPDLLLQ